MEYVSGRGRGTISEWIEERSTTCVATFHTTLRFLAVIENSLDWEDSQFRKMRFEAGRARLYEIRWKTDNTQWRVFGYFDYGRHEYRMLLGCYHKQNRYYPTQAIESAIKRKKDIDRGENLIQEYDYV
jgi:phage-related protein